MSQNTAWLPRQFQNGGLRSRFLRDEAETSVSGKAECLLAIGEDKKSKFFGPSPLKINNLFLLNKLFL